MYIFLFLFLSYCPTMIHYTYTCCVATCTSVTEIGIHIHTYLYILYMVQRTAELYTYLCLPHSICIVLTHRRRDRDTFFLRRGPLVFILNLDARLASSSSALSRSFAIWIIRSDLSIATSFKSLSSIGSHF